MYSFFKRELSAWIIIRAKSLCQYQSGTSSTTAGFDDWLGKGATDNKVYFGMKDGTAQYTGITKQTKNARLNQHNNAGKAFDDLDIQYEGLTRNQARAIEQYYIEKYFSTIYQKNWLMKKKQNTYQRKF